MIFNIYELLHWIVEKINEIFLKYLSYQLLRSIE